MADNNYIQVGETAMRDPLTGKYLHSVPLYIRADDAAVAQEGHLIESIGQLMAAKMRQYVDGCKAAGVSV